MSPLYSCLYQTGQRFAVCPFVLLCVSSRTKVCNMSTCTPFCVKQGRGLKYVTLYSCLCQTGQRSAICPLVHVLLYPCFCQTEQRSAICLFCTPVCVKQGKDLQYVSFVLLSVSYRTKVCIMSPLYSCLCPTGQRSVIYPLVLVSVSNRAKVCNMSFYTPICVKQGKGLQYVPLYSWFVKQSKGLQYVPLYSCLCQTGQWSAICPLVLLSLSNRAKVCNVSPLYSYLCQTGQWSAICPLVLLSLSNRAKVCNVSPLYSFLCQTGQRSAICLFCTPVCVMYHVSVPVCPIVPLYVPNSTMIYIIAIDKRGIQINIFLFTH